MTGVGWHRERTIARSRISCTELTSLRNTGTDEYLQNIKYNAFAPRLGLLWDPKGDGNTAIRAGFGMFYQRDRTSPLGYALTNNVPFVLNANVSRTLDGPNAPGLPTGGASPTGGVNPGAIIPYSMQWNLAAEHAFSKSMTLELAYVGNHAVHVLDDYDANAPNPQDWLAGAFPELKAAEWVVFVHTVLESGANLNMFAHAGDANYNALQALFKYQVQKFQVQAAYTYSHSLGDVQLDDSSAGLGWHTWLWGGNPHLNYGNTQINRPQIFVANLVYYLPDLKDQHEVVQAIAGGWELGAITQYASGTSTTFSQNGISEDTSRTIGNVNGGLTTLVGTGYTGNQRPLWSGDGCSAGTGGSQVLQPNAATLVGYRDGTIPSNIMRIGSCPGPGYVNTDFSIDKNWRVWGERVRIQFRFDMFNLFNHANFNGGSSINGTQGGDIANSVNCGAANGAGQYQPCSITNNIISRQTLGNTLGQATQAKNAREMQYGLKIIF